MTLLNCKSYLIQIHQRLSMLLTVEVKVCTIVCKAFHSLSPPLVPDLFVGLPLLASSTRRAVDTSDLCFRSSSGWLYGWLLTLLSSSLTCHFISESCPDHHSEKCPSPPWYFLTSFFPHYIYSYLAYCLFYLFVFYCLSLS